MKKHFQSVGWEALIYNPSVSFLFSLIHIIADDVQKEVADGTKQPAIKTNRKCGDLNLEKFHTSVLLKKTACLFILEAQAQT